MYFTKFLKGINGLDDTTAEDILINRGISCNWWLAVGNISPQQIRDRLNEPNVYWHLEHYDDPQPPSSIPFREDTPFISTTAGVVERERFLRRNVVYPAFVTALQFATDFYRSPGFIFYGYLITLGRKAVPFMEYAEEVRELNLYTSYLRFHDEGELVAKIHIPTPRLERVEMWDPKKVFGDLQSGKRPDPVWTKLNPGYESPEKYSNIREVLT